MIEWSETPAPIKVFNNAEVYTPWIQSKPFNGYILQAERYDKRGRAAIGYYIYKDEGDPLSRHFYQSSDHRYIEGELTAEYAKAELVEFFKSYLEDIYDEYYFKVSELDSLISAIEEGKP